MDSDWVGIGFFSKVKGEILNPDMTKTTKSSHALYSHI